jgi:hypothetical protein
VVSTSSPDVEHGAAGLPVAADVRQKLSDASSQIEVAAGPEVPSEFFSQG